MGNSSGKKETSRFLSRKGSVAAMADSTNLEEKQVAELLQVRDPFFPSLLHFFPHVPFLLGPSSSNRSQHLAVSETPKHLIA